MSLNLYRWNELDDADRGALLRRPAVAAGASVEATVREILDAVRREGDEAVRRLTRELDRADVGELRVPEEDFAAAEAGLGREAVAAIDRAIETVYSFHRAQLPEAVRVETAPGVVCERLSHPLDAVGLYVPAGTAPLPSAAIMLAVPAVIAGCPERILCTPPRQDGTADPAVLVAARRAGATAVYRMGGAQAVAAMAYGTESVPRVNKIFGPGNAWVTAAKSLVAADPDGAALDMPAGPSEVLVIADGDADPSFVASDLLSQAEHGPDSQVFLVTPDAGLAAAVAEAVEEQTAALGRGTIVREALSHSAVIVVDDLAEAVRVSNAYAPEHLIVQAADARDWLPRIRNAGSVFLGPWTPESMGDYCSGTNHVLPTYGYARTYSGLGVDQFLRYMTVQELSAAGLEGLGPTAVTLAGLEGLDAHARAVTLRLEKIRRRTVA
ncbi:MAG: histidinol dehydrogenase [Gammaproteobacteria bacterium]|jgi:histidinol dehydrogenase|nr:histidinol dehydrogenase [Gammaproteobacteria bacterium]